MDYLGTEDDDTITGTAGNDFFDMSQGGNDTVSGGQGEDQFYFGAALNADDRIDGGVGGAGARNELIIKGDYSAGLVFNDTTMVNVGTLTLLGGFDYNLTLADGNVGRKGLIVDATELGASQALTFDGSAVTGGGLRIKSLAGHNNLTGGSHDDLFSLGATFNAANEHIDGGGGTNYVELSGRYAPLTFDALTEANLVNTGFLFSGRFKYHVTLTSDYAAGESLALGLDNLKGDFSLDASASGADLSVFLYGTKQPAVASLVMGSGDDTVDLRLCSVDLSHGGNDTVRANSATVTMGASFTAEDSITGTGGNVTVKLNGDYASGVVFGANTMVNVTEIDLASGHSYSLTGNDNTHTNMFVNGASLGENDHLFFDGSAETSAGYRLTGGAGSDTLIGGAGGNTLTGGGGADILVGGENDDVMTGNGGHDTIDISQGGHDQIVFNAATDSSLAYDTVIGFNTRDDIFLVDNKVTGVDAAVTSGHLDGDMGTATFRDELQAIIDAGHLQASHAVVFTPDSGSLAGKVFLIVDQNGHAGFQASEDLVIQLDGALTLDLLSKADFHAH